MLWASPCERTLSDSPTLLVGGVLTESSTSLPPPYRNALCGKLQCSNVDSGTIFGIAPSIISTPIGSSMCYGVDFMLGSDVPDPGMVSEGTKCGDNKVGGEVLLLPLIKTTLAFL